MSRDCLLLLLLLPSLAASETCLGACDCTSQTVNCHSKGLASVPVGIPADTKNLDLSNNNIKSIEEGVFVNLTDLETLKFTDNKLTRIPAGSLQGLTRLKKLFLTRNQLTDFPDFCDDASQVQHLALDENKIDGKDLPENYSKCPNLNSLVLTKNTFATLKNSTLQALKALGLQSVKFNNVKMAAIEPGAFEPVKASLKSLDLSENFFNESVLQPVFATTAFSNQFNGLTLKKSMIVRLTDHLFQDKHFSALNILHLDNSVLLNAIAENAFANVGSLTLLFLNGCSQLKQLAEQLRPLQNLRSLTLAQSGLETWTGDTFDSLTSLKKLDISDGSFEFIGGLDGTENPLKLLTTGQLDNSSLVIGKNKLKCDCRLLWLTQQLLNESVKAKVQNVDKVTCQKPDGGTVKLVDFKPTNCTHTSTTHTTTDVTTAPGNVTTTSGDVTTTSGNVTTTSGDVTTTSGDITTTTTTPTDSQKSSMKTWMVVGLVVVVVVLLLVILTMGILLARRRRPVFGRDDDEPLLDSGMGCLRFRRLAGTVPVNVEPEYVE